MKERGSVRSTLEIDLRSPTVKLNWIIVQPCLSRKELKNSRTGAYRLLFSASFFSSPILRGVHGSGEFKDCQAFTFQMDGVAVGAEVQKCGDSGLELVVRERSNLVRS
jgi:hypothetical protein